ncbi:MAG: hypothetical protein J6O04_08445 [Selenomonadaceae bacterium]|nr:hypothetical protein [Selenomonadaceae bacterium]
MAKYNKPIVAFSGMIEGIIPLAVGVSLSAAAGLSAAKMLAIGTAAALAASRSSAKGGHSIGFNYLGTLAPRKVLV